ncbi:MAG: transcriptional regulator [Fusobacterium sp.]|uniref:transcriptional regulator n=1 Tax=Fusobacterium sp. TaxID=68766 RepID=UPI0039944D88
MNVQNQLITVKEVCEICKVKEKTAYKIIQKINDEMKADGFLVIRGKVNEKKLKERFGLE